MDAIEKKIKNKDQKVALIYSIIKILSLSI